MTTTTVHPTVKLSDAETAAIAYAFAYEIEDAPADTRSDRQRIRHMLNLMDAAEQGAVDPVDVLPFKERFEAMVRGARETVEHDQRTIANLTASGDTSDLWPDRSLEDNFATLQGNLKGSEEGRATAECLLALAERCEGELR